MEEIRRAARRACDNIVELTIEEEVAFVLLAGIRLHGAWLHVSSMSSGTCDF